jgi:hypothetical protein
MRVIILNLVILSVAIKLLLIAACWEPHFLMRCHYISLLTHSTLDYFLPYKHLSLLIKINACPGWEQNCSSLVTLAYYAQWQIKWFFITGFRIIGGAPIKKHEYPWLCSLKLKGGHICGITLISVYPQETILVGAAHCYNNGNFPLALKAQLHFHFRHEYSHNSQALWRMLVIIKNVFFISN